MVMRHCVPSEVLCGHWEGIRCGGIGFPSKADRVNGHLHGWTKMAPYACVIRDSHHRPAIPFRSPALQTP